VARTPKDQKAGPQQEFPPPSTTPPAWGSFSHPSDSDPNFSGAPYTEGNFPRPEGPSHAEPYRAPIPARSSRGGPPYNLPGSGPPYRLPTDQILIDPTLPNQPFPGQKSKRLPKISLPKISLPSVTRKPKPAPPIFQVGQPLSKSRVSPYRLFVKILKLVLSLAFTALLIIGAVAGLSYLHQRPPINGANNYLLAVQAQNWPATAELSCPGVPRSTTVASAKQLFTTVGASIQSYDLTHAVLTKNSATVTGTITGSHYVYNVTLHLSQQPKSNTWLVCTTSLSTASPAK